MSSTERPVYKVFACEVMRAEVECLAGSSALSGMLDIEWMEMGLHERPELLKKELEKRLADSAGRGYKAILLLFGLCSNATAGLTPPADTVLVIPRVHDCISIYLGSARTFAAEQADQTGTYWFSRGFLHRSDGGSPEMSGLGAGSMSDITGELGVRMSVAEMRRKYAEEYGEENADYLIEVLVESWKKNYNRAVYLRWDGSADADADADADYVKSYAADNNWEYHERPVDLRLLEALLSGEWNEDEFAVVRPGQTIVATHDAMALTAQ